MNKRIYGNFFDCIVVDNKEPSPAKLSFALSKRYFNAVKRNTIKRRIRALCQVDYGALNGNYRFVAKKRFPLYEKKIFYSSLKKIFTELSNG